MKFLKTVLGFSIILFFILPSQSSLIITPLTLDISLVGGQTIDRGITIKNDGTADVTVSINTSVSPDSEGITITYSTTSLFVVKAKTTQQINMKINTSLYLAPGTYVITTNFYTDYTAPKKTVHYHWNPVLSPVNATNETTPPIIPPEEENNTNNTIPVIQPPVKAGFEYGWVSIPPILIAAIVTLLIFLYKRRKNKRGKRNTNI